MSLLSKQFAREHTSSPDDFKTRAGISKTHAARSHKKNKTCRTPPGFLNIPLPGVSESEDGKQHDFPISIKQEEHDEDGTIGLNENSVKEELFDTPIKRRSSLSTSTYQYQPPEAHKEELSLKKELAYTHYVIYSFPPLHNADESDEGGRCSALGISDHDDDEVVEIRDGEPVTVYPLGCRSVKPADNTIEIQDEDDNDDDDEVVMVSSQTVSTLPDEDGSRGLVAAQGSDENDCTILFSFTVRKHPLV
ncbi:hypothetical protein F5Y16DRAFT_423760 [Xylariaceae sp. FL0255]|nr:hypothetical protein F5Y16DRAFT_423760 [Xylariaceae sp. FL0255]